MAVTNTPTNVVLPGPCRVFMCSLASGAAVGPLDTVAYGADWAGSPAWTYVGMTEGGVVAETSWSNYVVKPDQYNAGVAEARIQDDIKVSFAMLEATITNIKQSMGIGTITTGSTSTTFGVAGNDTIITPYGLGFESYAAPLATSTSKFRRLVVWRAIQDAGFPLEAKREGAQVIGASFHGQIDTAQTASEQLWKLIDKTI